VLKLFSQLIDVLPLKMPNQMDRRYSALCILFNLHFAIASLQTVDCHSASAVPTQTIELAGLTTREIAGLSGILIIQKN
jgi:hypothetical protein